MDAMMPSRRTVLRSIGGAGVLAVAGGAIQGTHAQQSPEEAWPRPRYDVAHTGFAPENTVPAGDVVEAWTVDVESWRTFEPVVADGSWIRVTPDGDVIATSMADGTERWWVEFHADSVSLRSAVDGTVYVQTASESEPDNPTLHALSAADGSEQWQRSEGATTIADDAIYRASDGLASTTTADGRSRWRTAGAFSTVSVGDGTVYAIGVRDPDTHPSRHDERVLAFSASDGTQQWQFEPNGEEISTAVISGDTVYFTTSASLLYAVSASDGTERWTSVVSPGTAPVVADDTVYVVDSGALLALSASDGTERWRYTADFTGASPIIVGDTVFVGTDEGLHALAAEDGTERWHFETQWPVKQSPAVVDGTVLFVARKPRPKPGGTVYALSGTATPTPTATPTSSTPPATESTTETTSSRPTTETTSPPPSTETTASQSTTSDTVTASTASSPANEESGTAVSEMATTDEDGPGFGVLSALAGLGVSGWRVLANGDDD